MSRIDQAFAKKAKIAYLTAGDAASLNDSINYFLSLVAGGANLLEIGVPYSDPIADGPVIQLAMERALNRQTTLNDVLEIVRQIRSKSTVAMIVFTYYNPVQADLAGFLYQLKAAGADGVLIVDLPDEEAANYRFICHQLDLASITVIAPSTSIQRMHKILHGVKTGFIYYACQKGTTGAKDSLPLDLSLKLSQLRQVSKLPVAVGFGVANQAMVKDILYLADGCVVGSYLVQQVEKKVSLEAMKSIVEELFNVT
jgi:tryptophan synthase alpha chain